MFTLPESLPKLIGYNYDSRSENYIKYDGLIGGTSRSYPYKKDAIVHLGDLKKALELVNEMESEDLALRPRNAENLKVIVDTQNQLIEWFKSVSFPTRIWSRIDLKEEKRTKDNKQVDAHWLIAIKQAFNELMPHYHFTVDASYIKIRYNDMRANIARIEEKVQKDVASLTREREQEKEEKKKLFLIFELATKYNLLPVDEVSPYDIERHILFQDKYLDLAWAMEQTRGDWSEGFWRVEEAMRRFEITSPIDSAIYDELSEIMSSDESDGRVFRDITHDYDFIYQLVENKELEVDLRRISEYSRY